MALGYKYVERDVDSQLNWAEVGRSLSGVLLEEKRVREEKKATIDEITRDSLNNLANAPKGQNQDVNNVLSNFTDDIQKAQLLDEKLLKSGQMDPKLYILRTQNRKDGTDKVFKIGETLQANSDKIMEGINTNEIQTALGLHNMGSIEELGNLNNIRITTDSLGDGKMGIARYKTEIINGQEVRVLSEDTTPVDVLMNMIHYQPKKFDVEGNTAATAKAFGTRFQAVYKAASTVGSGTITELLGIDAMKKYPKFKGIVDEMNLAIDEQIGSYFASPDNMNLVSVLGDNVGEYSSESFTYDKDLAAKDPKKILLKIDPRTQTPVMDSDGPNFKKQKEQATAWMKRNLLSKLDSESKISTTGQLSETEAQKLRAQLKYPKPKAGGEDDTKPVGVGEIIVVRTTDKSGKKSTTGVSQRLENMIIDEGEGVQNVATDIGYNNKTGTLEVKGYQISGKSQQGKKTEVEEGITGTRGSTFVKKEKFLKNDINSASLVSVIVTKIPNPERPGYNFSNINEAKNYYKRQYQSQTGKKELD